MKIKQILLFQNWKQVTTLIFPKYFVILSKWKCYNILHISFISLSATNSNNNNVTLHISFCIVMLTNFHYFLIRLLFPALINVPLLICRATVFRFKICVNKSFCCCCCLLNWIRLLSPSTSLYGLKSVSPA